jgi:poly-gamma-glutamate synthesis protein (capsule biosynthesis protein)
VVNLIDEEQIEKDMMEAKRMEPDAIIVLMHWGAEYQRNENKEQSALAKKLFTWGADLVVGAHPHVVQPIKEQTIQEGNNRGKRVVVAYSLGNFISGQRKAHTDGGMMFSVELSKNLKDNTTWISDHSYSLVWRYIEEDEDGKKIYRALPIKDFEGENPPLELPKSDRNAMIEYAKSTRALLEKYDSREAEVITEVPAAVSKE